MHKILTTILVFFCIAASSQEIVFQYNVDTSFTQKQYGQNLKHYFHAYIGGGSIVGEHYSDTIQINYGKSYLASFGLRYKYKISSFYSIGYSSELKYSAYNIKQNQSKSFIDKIGHLNEKIRLFTFCIEFYNRINFGKRGNIIGKYIDLGIYADVSFASAHIITDEKTGINSGKKSDIEIKTKSLKYINPSNYGFIARLGYNKISFFTIYRVSQLFTPSSGFSDLPKITAGMQLAIF